MFVNQTNFRSVFCLLYFSVLYFTWQTMIRPKRVKKKNMLETVKC